MRRTDEWVPLGWSRVVTWEGALQVQRCHGWICLLYSESTNNKSVPVKTGSRRVSKKLGIYLDSLAHLCVQINI
jgi:hypothetical protein